MQRLTNYMQRVTLAFESLAGLVGPSAGCSTSQPVVRELSRSPQGVSDADSLTPPCSVYLVIAGYSDRQFVLNNVEYLHIILTCTYFGILRCIVVVYRKLCRRIIVVILWPWDPRKLFWNLWVTAPNYHYCNVGRREARAIYSVPRLVIRIQAFLIVVCRLLVAAGMLAHVIKFYNKSSVSPETV